MRIEKYVRLYEADPVLGKGFALSNVKLSHCDGMELEEYEKGDLTLPGLEVRADYSVSELKSYLANVHFCNMGESRENDDIEARHELVADILYRIFTNLKTVWKITFMQVNAGYAEIYLYRVAKDGGHSHIRVCLNTKKADKELTMRVDTIKQGKKHYRIRILSDMSIISIYKRKKGNLILKKEETFFIQPPPLSPEGKSRARSP